MQDERGFGEYFRARGSKADTALCMAACRRVQEAQEKINEMQEELKKAVADAEATRIESAIAIRKQNALKTVRLPIANALRVM